MALPAILRRFATRPAWACGAAALVLRTCLVLHAWQSNPLARDQQIDGQYYLQWAGQIAQGDVAGRGGIVEGAPWVLNPLYAYVLAALKAAIVDPFLSPPAAALPDAFGPIVWSDSGVLCILLFQAVLAAGTTVLAAAAASRFFDRRAGWVAGVLVACAAPLAQLDGHVAVAELSAFLVAGACFACAPPTPGDRKWAHGPVAAGLWLGIGALARPITPLAVPFVMWRYARGTPRRWRDGLVVAAVVAACAAPSLLRNWAVGGEPDVYTAAGGINVHLGNNPDARDHRCMMSPHIRFNPLDMHEDARLWVQEAIGRRPSPAEVSSWFWMMTIDECVRAPGASALHYANKARWFFGPTEVPSSASYASDVEQAPLLRIAFVPAWLIASLAAAGAWAHRRRADVLCGPGALALAHWAMLTLVFPLSHYRAPALPALAVLAAGAVTAAWTAWTEARRRAAVGIVFVAAGAAIVGVVPPGPDPLKMRDVLVLARHWQKDGQLERALGLAREGRDAFVAQWGTESSKPWELIGEIEFKRGNWAAARDALTRAVEIDGDEPYPPLLLSNAYEHLHEYALAEKWARYVIEKYPFLPDAHARLGVLLWSLPGRHAEAVIEIRKALTGGFQFDPDVAERLGIAPPAPPPAPPRK